MQGCFRKFEKEHEAVIGCNKISYKSRSEDYPIYGKDGTLIGTMFTYTYIRTDVESSENRPVLFAYNGGPGSSSIWIHAGLMAPKRVKLENPVEPRTTPPFELEDNPLCLLDICDIVIIDPLGTGLSVVVDQERQKECYSFEKDAQLFSDFIEDWIAKEGRYNSPKYLLGESYGTLRSCIIPNALMGGALSKEGLLRGLTIDGIIMLGSVVTVNPKPSYDEEHGVELTVLKFPTMAACNWYHNPDGKPPLADFIQEAALFAETDLITGLYRGNSLTAEQENALAHRMAYFTGLPEAYLRNKRFRITTGEFGKKLLMQQGKEIGRYDGRYCMSASSGLGMADPVADESAMGRYTPAFRGGFMKLAEELGIEGISSYNIINFNVNGMWEYDAVKTPMEYLSAALRRNKEMRVLVCSGIYDLDTSIGQARYMVNHLDYEPGQVIVREYPSGHMSYIGEESGQKMRKDFRDFIQKKEM